MTPDSPWLSELEYHARECIPELVAVVRAAEEWDNAHLSLADATSTETDGELRRKYAALRSRVTSLPAPPVGEP